MPRPRRSLVLVKKLLDSIPRYRRHTPRRTWRRWKNTKPRSLLIWVLSSLQRVDRREKTKMIRRIAFLFLAVAFAAVAANPPDFSGTWVFNAGKSKNIGMMASPEYTSTITQNSK